MVKRKPNVKTTKMNLKKKLFALVVNFQACMCGRLQWMDKSPQKPKPRVVNTTSRTTTTTKTTTNVAFVGHCPVNTKNL